LSDKTARVRIFFNPERVETLTGAIAAWVRKSGKEIAGLGPKLKSTITSAARAIEKVILVDKQGFIKALQTLDVKALSVARKIKQYFKDAFKDPSEKKKKDGDKQSLFSRGKDALTFAAGSLIASGVQTGISTASTLVKEANKVYEASNRISIGARGAGQSYVDPRQLTKEFFDVTKDVKGITAEGAADAASKFVSLTGDLQTARSSMKDFAIAATASGAEIGDVSEAVASISTQFGVTDPKQIREVLSALIYQGKAGSFELKDAAAQFQRLAASGAAFGIQKNAQGVKTLGGLTHRRWRCS
jgi:hypothetical protein